MTCQPEHVTGYVDGALEPPDREAIEAHLVDCEACRAQAEAERSVRARLLGTLHPPLPPTLEARVRRGLRTRNGIPVHRLLLPLAAAAAVVLLWVRQWSPALAWQMARDHQHCFGKERLPAQVWAEDAETVMRWFEKKGTRVPVLPESAAGYHLAGARYCPFPDMTHAAHIYYRSEKDTLSLFVVARGVEPRDAPFVMRGQVVGVARYGGMTIGVVGDKREDVDTFVRTFRTSRAALD